MIIEVVAGIVRKEGQILVAQRPEYLTSGGFWEFPGGKIEPGETYEQTLLRELMEEVGIEVLEAASFLNFDYQGPKRLVKLNFWEVLEFKGEPFGAEGQLVKWLTLEEIYKINMLPANAQVIEKLKQRQNNGN